MVRLPVAIYVMDNFCVRFFLFLLFLMFQSTKAKGLALFSDHISTMEVLVLSVGLDYRRSISHVSISYQVDSRFLSTSDCFLRPTGDDCGLKDSISVELHLFLFCVLSLSLLVLLQTMMCDV